MLHIDAKVNKYPNFAVKVLKKILNIEKNISKAVLYVTGLGQYEGFVNGEALDERIIFAPVVSNYQKTVYYNIKLNIFKFLN